MTADRLSTQDEPMPDELQQIPAEEERVLARVQKHIASRRLRPTGSGNDYDVQLLALRDQINEARLEDIPPLIEEMERLSEVAARRAKVSEGAIDPLSPYFGRMILEEDERRREVLIGRSTYLDGRTGIRVVDWRDAPVSRIYYRYEEGDEYEETFGGREVIGEIQTRRSVVIRAGELRRISAPQATFVRAAGGAWRHARDTARRLSGGQGAAMRAELHHRPGRLGVGNADAREERYLPEITALIDPRQFELITSPHSGLVVIQGGAGSGKTTIALHRLAYLNFQDRRRFRPDRMLVIVFNDALRRYISRVLPALGVEGVPVTTFERWAQRQRQQSVRGLPTTYDEDTPQSVTRVKKHPNMLIAVDRVVAQVEDKVARMLHASLGDLEGRDEALALFHKYDNLPLGQRLEQLGRWVRPTRGDDGRVRHARPLSLRHAVERCVERGQTLARDIPSVWADLLTDLPLLESTFAGAQPALSRDDLRSAHRWCSRRCPPALSEVEERLAAERDGRRRGGEGKRPEPLGERDRGIDGLSEREALHLDREDDAILLRIRQRLWGPLLRGNEALRYGHIVVDEAQDLSPVELAVVMDTASRDKSVTLAGDTAQRLMMDNGFEDWATVLHNLGLDHVAVEPLKISYRSTSQIIEFAGEVLGPLAPRETSRATRDGAPVEFFEFGHTGEAVAFLGEALRELMGQEQRASVAVIARYPEQADVYYDGLVKAEVPFARRIAQQDFPFRSGIDVTDARQVKGLEFDYVVLVEVSSAAYPPDDEARHLLHIAATRAAHQLWVLSTGEPSPLIRARL